ncbi:Putative RxLR effector [Phytophthora palmivora]|uniref:RxLR effector n=1 Tax=Phytophthora palmivora TaxID=4796 RepID=A0A2P4Y177_9STRA|nr:Putative RxLR effector [Phytophthora palmivora]
MRYTFLLTLSAATFVANNVNSVGAEETAPNNIEINRISGIKTTDSGNIVRRLRWNKEVRDMGGDVGVINLSDSTSTHSSQLLHAVKNKKPLPKFARAILLLLLSVAGGALLIGTKPTDN